MQGPPGVDESELLLSRGCDALIAPITPKGLPGRQSEDQTALPDARTRIRAGVLQEDRPVSDHARRRHPDGRDRGRPRSAHGRVRDVQPGQGAGLRQHGNHHLPEDHLAVGGAGVGGNPRADGKRFLAVRRRGQSQGARARHEIHPRAGPGPGEAQVRGAVSPIDSLASEMLQIGHNEPKGRQMTCTKRQLSCRLPLTIGASILCFSLPAQAGGLYVGEFGQPNQGASRAGGHALAEDASTAAQNPAGTMFLDGSRSMVTGIGIFSEIKFKQRETFPATATAVANANGTGAASDGGDAGGTGVGGAYFYANPVSDKWGWSMAVNSVSGAVLDHENADDFAGRYWASEVEIFTLNLMPSLSYKVRDDLSVAVSLPVTYGALDMDVSIPGPAPGAPEGSAKISDGDELTVGFGVSALWQANDSLRLGLVYQSETEMDFDSDLKITPPLGVGSSSISSNVEFTYPQTVRASATQDINDELTLLGTVAWEDWSALDDILISTPAGSDALSRDWDDTWFSQSACAGSRGLAGRITRG